LGWHRNYKALAEAKGGGSRNVRPSADL